MKPTRRRPIAPAPMLDINTTPLIDVMLVLLIMLIITIPAQLHSVNLDLPGSSKSPQSVRTVVRIDITEQDLLRWDGQAIAQAELPDRMAKAAQENPPPELHIRPQPGSHYASLVHVMATAQKQGLKKLGVIGIEQFAH